MCLPLFINLLIFLCSGIKLFTLFSLILSGIFSMVVHPCRLLIRHSTKSVGSVDTFCCYGFHNTQTRYFHHFYMFLYFIYWFVKINPLHLWCLFRIKVGFLQFKGILLSMKRAKRYKGLGCPWSSRSQTKVWLLFFKERF